MDSATTLKHVPGRVVVSCDIESKNWHTFEDGFKIRLERNYNNLDVKHTRPVNAYVIDGEGLIPGSEIIIHPNATIDSNKIFNYGKLSGEAEGSDVKLFSVPVEQCFAWRDGKNWLPLKGFEFALRVYEPYRGTLLGIPPKQITDTLYITTGDLKGQVVRTLKAVDYELIFQDISGREARLIRLRHFPDEINEREEVTAIDHSMTEKVNKGELFVGLSPDDAKSINNG